MHVEFTIAWWLVGLIVWTAAGLTFAWVNGDSTQAPGPRGLWPTWRYALYVLAHGPAMWGIAAYLEITERSDG